MHALRAYDDWRNCGNYGAWRLTIKTFHVKFSPNFLVNLERLQKSPTNSRKNVVIEQTLTRDEDNLQLYLREFPWFFGNIPSVAPKKAKSESISLEKKKTLVRPISNVRGKVGRIFIDTYKKTRVNKNRARTLSTRWTLHSRSRIFTAAQFNGSANKISFKNAPLKEDHWKNGISVWDGETRGAWTPQFQAKKKKPNESGVSELQDFKIFWGRFPQTPQHYGASGARLWSLHPSQFKHAPLSLSVRARLLHFHLNRNVH